MKLYPKKLWRFSGIIESNDNIHKYNALLLNNETNKLEQVGFGYIYDTHYFDSTGLNSYSHLNNNNIMMKYDYITSHKKNVFEEFYNEIYFELKYLWDYDK